MITYCIGSARQKRAYFKTLKDAVVLDNAEVLFCASENGRNYFAYGYIPFAGFEVGEYLAYRRALCREKVEDATVRAFGLDPRKRLEKLCAAELRTLTFLEKTAGATADPVVVNLDGAKYTRKNVRTLNRLLARFTSDVYVCVTDMRFVKKANCHMTMEFGKSKGRRPKFYTAKRLAKRINACRVAVM